MNNATIDAALADPACQRLAEWAAIGPVQRAALASFADRIALPERLVRFTLRDLKAERARLDGFLALGNEVARAAEYDQWIAALEAYCRQYATVSTVAVLAAA